MRYVSPSSPCVAQTLAEVHCELAPGLQVVAVFIGATAASRNAYAVVRSLAMQLVKHFGLVGSTGMMDSRTEVDTRACWRSHAGSS